MLTFIFNQALRSELSTVDRRLSDRECKWQRKVDDLQDELNLHQELKSETSSSNYLSLTENDPTIIKREHEGRHSLRIQVEGLKQTVNVLNKDIEDKSDQLKSTEASLRSEVIIPTKMPSLTKIQIDSDRVSNEDSVGGEMERRISEDSGVRVHTLSERDRDSINDDLNDDDNETTITSPVPSPLVRYKSLRDHNGRFCLVVKIA